MGALMLPRTKAGYAAVLLTVLSLGFLVARVVLLWRGSVVDADLTLLSNSTVAGAVAALVWMVHQNGGKRG